MWRRGKRKQQWSHTKPVQKLQLKLKQGKLNENEQQAEILKCSRCKPSRREMVTIANSGIIQLKPYNADSVQMLLKDEMLLFFIIAANYTSIISQGNPHSSKFVHSDSLGNKLSKILSHMMQVPVNE